MRVVFLALGATRRRAVVAESAEVIAEGGTAVVVIEQASAWQQEKFAPAVEVLELARLKARHSPLWLEQMFLYRGPRFLMYRVLGRGPLRAHAGRAARAYQRRVADRVHRRIFLPVYRRLWPDVTARLLERHLLRAASAPTLVAADPLSIPDAARILHRCRSRGARPPSLCYTIDHVAREAPAARR